MTEREASIARQWDRHGEHPFFDASRLQYGRLIFSPLQYFYASCFEDLEKGLPNALDLGCGSADNLIRLLQTGVAHAGTGIEISERMVANADRLRVHFQIPQERLRVLRGSIDDTEIGDRFSLIIATQILGYVEDSARFMRRAASLALPGAYLFVCDRHRLSLTPLQAVKNNPPVRRLLGKPALESLPRELHVHPLDEIERHAAAAGFRPLWRRYSLHPLSAVCHSAAHGLNAGHYGPGPRRSVSSALFRTLTAIRRAEDALLRRVPTGYLYAVLFRKHP